MESNLKGESNNNFDALPTDVKGIIFNLLPAETVAMYEPDLAS
jgi:hypothetical protein